MTMKNITLSADENLIASARAYAQAHGTTLNDLIRDYLKVWQSARPEGSCGGVCQVGP